MFQNLIAADNASETLAGLKRIHGLMPYFMLKTALKISNPVSMIRSAFPFFRFPRGGAERWGTLAVLDLFMAQPFGGRSLLQRMFTSSLQEEVRVLEEEIEASEKNLKTVTEQYVSVLRDTRLLYQQGMR